jgi:hypothetical protein
LLSTGEIYFIDIVIVMEGFVFLKMALRQINREDAKEHENRFLHHKSIGSCFI